MKSSRPSVNCRRMPVPTGIRVWICAIIITSVLATGPAYGQYGSVYLDHVDGYAYGKEFFAKATEQGAWVDYKWKDPMTGEVLPKSSWLVLHDGFIFGSGIYKP